MKSKSFTILLIIASLALAALSCQLVSPKPPEGEDTTQENAPLSGEGDVEESSSEGEDTLVTEAPPEQPAAETKYDTEFPLPTGVENFMEMGGGINFQVAMDINDVIAFYQEAFTKQGLVERQLLHVEAEGTFSMVFDGAPNGQALVIQGVDLGDGKVNINIRYEDV